jgi:hypothetical protein
VSESACVPHTIRIAHSQSHFRALSRLLEHVGAGFVMRYAPQLSKRLIVEEVDMNAVHGAQGCAAVAATISYISRRLRASRYAASVMARAVLSLVVSSL